MAEVVIVPVPRLRRPSWAGAARAACLAALASAAASGAWGRDLVVVGGGAAVPMGDANAFADPGAGLEIRYRHYNTGKSAFEFSVGAFQSPVSGAIPDSIASFEALVRQKNLLAQQQSGPGNGFVLAEYGKLEVYNINVNFLYRFNQRARFSPQASVGGGVYVWRLPFRVQFFDVPSFGEQHAYDAIGNSGYQFVFDDRLPPQVIDFTKHKASGGLNAALGLDTRLTRTWGFEVEGRAHLLFSSGDGDLENLADNQEYLDNMSFLYVQGSLYYRF